MDEITVKHGRDEVRLSLETEKTTLGSLKKLLESLFDVPRERQNIVSKGSICKEDDRTLEEYKITKDSVLYLGVRSENQALLQSVYGKTKKALGNVKTIQEIEEKKKEAARAQQAFLKPFLELTAQNPELITQLITEQPMIKRLLEKNPELKDVMSDPSTIEQIKLSLQSPEAGKELLRGHDLALSNIEAISGGLEPLLAAQGMLKDSWPEKTQNVPSTTRSKKELQEARMPNPWRDIHYLGASENQSMTELGDETGEAQENLDHLLAMGYAKEEAEDALIVANGDLQKALGYLNQRGRKN